jgi:hypothetical protein
MTTLANKLAMAAEPTSYKAILKLHRRLAP